MASKNVPISTAEQYRLVASYAPGLTWLSGTDRSLYFFNENWLRFTGRTLEEETGEGWLSGLHPDDLPYWLKIYEQAFAERQPFETVCRLSDHDGLYRTLRMSAAPAFGPDGAFAGFAGSCYEVTAEGSETEQALNEELAASNEELVTINEELSQAQQSLQQLNSELETKVAERTKALTESEAEAQALNEELTASNEELSAINEEMAALNEEMTATNEELSQSRAHLEDINMQLQAALAATQHSEQLFRSIALNIPRSVVIVIDRDHRYLALEGDLMVKMGYDSRDYIGRHPLETGPAERYEAARPLYDRVLAGEQFSVERKAATGGDFLVHLVPLRNAHDEVYAGLVIALDITEIKQGQEKSAKLAAIIETSDDAIISKTLDSMITSWNDAAERIFGFTAEEMTGRSIYQIIPEDRHHEEPEIIARLKNGERVDHFETQRLTKDGRLIDVSVTVSPIKDAEGRIIGASKIARDITEKKLDEQRKNDFIAMVSHELKTPLTSLGAILQVLSGKLKESRDAFVPGALAKANLQVKKMTSMINGFLNLSRLEAGKIVIDKHAFEMEELIRELISEAELTVSSHHFRFTPCGPMTVNADRDKIGSVISNLLSNAVKYSPKGETVEVGCEVNEEAFTLSVTDHGIGISTEDREKLFDRYYRVEHQLTRHVSGFGIGLYLSAEIIQHHHGRIWVDSEPGKGSTFRFSLPLRG